jgi:hypothetical protein
MAMSSYGIRSPVSQGKNTFFGDGTMKLASGAVVKYVPINSCSIKFTKIEIK